MATSEGHLGRIYDRLATAQTRYAYFILAAAASAVALSLKRTEGEALSWSQLPLGLAVLCWGLSFFFGCRHLGYTTTTLQANLVLIQIRRGEHPEAGDHPGLMQAAADGAISAAKFNSDKANRYGHWQFRLLTTGAVLYVAWHAYTMYELKAG